MASRYTDSEILRIPIEKLTPYQRRIRAGLLKYPGASISQLRGKPAKGESSIEKFIKAGKLPIAKTKTNLKGTTRPAELISIKRRKIVQSGRGRIRYTDWKFRINPRSDKRIISLLKNDEAQAYELIPDKSRVDYLLSWLKDTELPRLLGNKISELNGQIILIGIRSNTLEKNRIPTGPADLSAWQLQLDSAWDKATEQEDYSLIPTELLIAVREFIK